MAFEMDGAAVARLEGYLGKIGTHLKDKRKRESFAMYAFGILGDGERKSAEPIAARACGDPEHAEAAHNKLLHFLAYAQWDDHKVRQIATEYAIGVLQQREPVTTWIIDDTGFLKQGSHSVGVQRQYTGSAGKVCNCQIGVSLAVATASEQLPIDFELYLPEPWANDAARRDKARIPADVQFKTKNDLALQMIERASLAGVPGEIILADSAYGDDTGFRNALRTMGFDYGVAIHSKTKVVPVDARGRVGKAQSALEMGRAMGRKRFRKLTWREGTKATLSSRFAFVRVKTAHDDGIDLLERETQWLVIEWPAGEEKPTKFILTTLPRRMSRKQIVRVFKERWRTERMYEDLKGELGLDHFEGRSFPGWHHHISVVLCCYAYVVAERASAFPPSEGWTCTNSALRRAA
jgi:SRSO17 transposase